MPRRRRIDNDRTRRHMYRHAHERRYYKVVIDRHDLLDLGPEGLTWIETEVMNELRKKGQELYKKLALQMRYKYPRRGAPRIEIRYMDDYDIDFDQSKWLVEAVYRGEMATPMVVEELGRLTANRVATSSEIRKILGIDN